MNVARSSPERMLYELSGKGDRRFSPFCWRARLALAHKGLSAQFVPVRYSEKELIAFSGQAKVPVLVDGGRVVTDSWDIACYLDEAYPDAPALFGDPMGRSLSQFLDIWGTRVAFPPLVRLVLCDAVDHLDEPDAAYVRDSRERQLGISLNALRDERDTNLPLFRDALAPLRSHLRRSAFLCGETAAYADYSVFGLFQWARMISSLRVLDEEDPVYLWRGRMLNLFGGLARDVPSYAD